MVEAVSATILSQPMFNLTVDTAHTFFVGEGQWLVHNDDCDKIEVTEDLIREAMQNASLKTKQEKVSLPVIQRYVDYLLSGQKTPPQIKVDGNTIVDGNHRYIANQVYNYVTGENIGINIWDYPQGNPNAPIIDWQNVKIDPYDWGNR